LRSFSDFSVGVIGNGGQFRKCRGPQFLQGNCRNFSIFGALRPQFLDKFFRRSLRLRIGGRGEEMKYAGHHTFPQEILQRSQPECHPLVSTDLGGNFPPTNASLSSPQKPTRSPLKTLGLVSSVHSLVNTRVSTRVTLSSLDLSPAFSTPLTMGSTAFEY